MNTPFAVYVEVDMTTESQGMTQRREPLPKWLLSIALAALINSVVVACLPPSNVTVPDVRGASEPDATQMLTAQNLRLATTSEVVTGANPSTIVDQDPKPGTALPKDSVVSVTLEAPRATVPDLSGKSVGEATDMLTTRNLIVGTTLERITGGTPGAILKQDPATGAAVLRGSKVNVTVEASKVAVPNVIGKPQADVAAALTGQGLTLGTLTTDASGMDAPADSTDTIFAQDPTPGQSVAARSPVNLTAEAAVYSSGRIVLTFIAPAGSLDDGRTSATDLGDFSLAWTCPGCNNDADMSLQPQNGVTLANVGRAFVGLHKCESAVASSGSSSKIPLTVWTSGQWQEPSVGTYVCARTRQGRIAEFVQEENKDAFVFHYTTWKPLGRIIKVGPVINVGPVILRK